MLLKCPLKFCEDAGTRTRPLLRALCFPLSHVINPPAVSCLANRQTGSLQSPGTLLPPSCCTPTWEEVHQRTHFSLASRRAVLRLLSAGCDVTVREIQTRSSHHAAQPRCSDLIRSFSLFDSFIRHPAT